MAPSGVIRKCHRVREGVLRDMTERGGLCGFSMGVCRARGRVWGSKGGGRREGYLGGFQKVKGSRVG